MVDGVNSLNKQNEELLKRYYETEDFEAYQNILLLNDRLNYRIAKKFLNSGEDIEDLASISRIGMIKAIKSFDPNKEIKFATYATRCMTNEILMSFRREKKHKNNVSLEQPLYYDGEGNELKLEDLIESGAPDAIDSYIEKENLARLRQAVSELEGRDRVIIEEMYFKGKTQKQVAQLLEISQSYISRIEKKVLKKLRGIYDKTKGEVIVANKIKPEKLEVLIKCYEEGLNPREASEVAGVSHTTAYKYRKEHLAEQLKEEAPVVAEAPKEEKEVIKESKVVEMIKSVDVPKPKSNCSTVTMSLTRASKGEIHSILNSLMLTVNEEESYNLDILITKEVS